MPRIAKLLAAFILTGGAASLCHADAAADNHLVKSFIVKITAPASPYKAVPFTAISMTHRGDGANMNASQQETPFEDEVQADYVNLMLQSASSDPALKVELFEKKADGKAILISTAEGHDTVIGSFAGATNAIGW